MTTQAEQPAHADVDQLHTRVGHLLDFLDWQTIAGTNAVPVDEVRRYVGADPRPPTAIRGAEILIRPRPGDCHIRVGDVDITPAVLAIEVAATADVRTARLDVRLDRLDIDGETTVAVPADTARALAALGWTPPPA